MRRERQSCAVQGSELNERKCSGEVPQWQSEARYQSLVKAVAQVVWNTNAQGQVVNDLPSWRLLTGQSREAIQGWGWLNAIHPEERAETARRWTQAVATKGIYEIEHRVRLVDGSYRFFLARGIPVLDLEGEILEWVGTQTDITAQKQAQETLDQSQTKFPRLVANMPGMVYRYVPCTNGPDRFTFVNSACRELLELEAEIVLQDASSFVKLIHPDDLLSFQESVVTSAQNFLPWRWEGRIITPSGQLKWIQGSSCPERTAEEGDVWDGLLIDITERKRTEELLRESEERYALTAHAANDGLWDWNLASNKVYFSPRWKSLLGYEEDEISDSPDEWFERVHPEDVRQLKLAITAVPQELTSQSEENRRLHSHHEIKHNVLHFHFQVEHRILHKDGTYRWMLSRGIAVQGPYGNIYRLAGSQTDITERKRAEAQLLHNAFHDVLTGLPNRALFTDRLGHAILRTKRRDDCLFAVLFLDLDRFKVVNDSLGHLVGDELLQRLAQRLEASLRSGDTVARLGGDEFTMLLEDIKDISEATQVAERIQKELTLPFVLNGQEVFTTVSIGIALSSTGYHRPEEILRDADIAMYRAKNLGKARYSVFAPSMHTQAVILLQLETDLRLALEHQDFRLHYQPIVSLKTGEITGFEALVRWQHLLRGLLRPAEFISVAEETGLIIPIGRWVLREACLQMRTWHRQFPTQKEPLTLSVNLSVKQFMQPELVTQVAQILQETGLSACSLKLEITESVIMENTEAATVKLLQLKALGVQLCMDDFGTGYSSLSYLHRFPINMLKIDRSFVNNMTLSEQKLQIVQAIVTLAHNLDMAVTAEGVETSEQLAQLKALKCEFGQGYFFSRPVDSLEAGALIADEHNEKAQ